MRLLFPEITSIECSECRRPAAKPEQPPANRNRVHATPAGSSPASAYASPKQAHALCCQNR